MDSNDPNDDYYSKTSDSNAAAEAAATTNGDRRYTAAATLLPSKTLEEDPHEQSSVPSPSQRYATARFVLLLFCSNTQTPPPSPPEPGPFHVACGRGIVSIYCCRQHYVLVSFFVHAESSHLLLTLPYLAEEWICAKHCNDGAGLRKAWSLMPRALCRDRDDDSLQVARQQWKCTSHCNDGVGLRKAWSLVSELFSALGTTTRSKWLVDNGNAQTSANKAWAGAVSSDATEREIAVLVRSFQALGRAQP
jgi:hypothetical protein